MGCDIKLSQGILNTSIYQVAKPTQHLTPSSAFRPTCNHALQQLMRCKQTHILLFPISMHI
jgi:hypothetical protein